MSKRSVHVSGAYKTTPQERDEIIDLYLWGVRNKYIMMLYDISIFTLKGILKQRGVPRKPAGQPALANPKRKRDIKSSRPTPFADEASGSVQYQDVDQLIRSSAHAQQDKRIAERQQGASTDFCQE